MTKNNLGLIGLTFCA